MKIKIGNKNIGKNEPVFIVAEAGINHNGNIKIAKRLIKSAKKCGADAIKFQTFQASDLVMKKSKFFKIFKKLELKDSEFKELSEFAKKQKIIFFSTPFSFESVNLLNSLKVPFFKIASGDITNIPLIEYVASKKKPVIISTGTANETEIKAAVKAIKNKNNHKIILLHSVSAYPTPLNESNLKSIPFLSKLYPYPIGYSDNGADLIVPIVAVALGASLIEKHFTLKKTMSGPDHKLSANPDELKILIQRIRSVELMLGQEKKICQRSEMINKIHARRSITLLKSIPKGTILTKKIVGIKRPAKGIEPKFLNKVIGKRTMKKMQEDMPIKWNDLE